MQETQKQQRRRKILYARTLRKQMTYAEKILWEALRSRRCAGMKFRRQAPISWFVVDFLCIQQSLIIELDGSIHDNQKEYDRERDLELAERGYRILRLMNDDVIHHLDQCLTKIITTAKS